MAKRGPTYRIDPIGPDEVRPRFAALLDRLSPSLAAEDVATVRALMAKGSLGDAYERLDALTNEVTVPVDTATLVELVLLGQAIRRPAG
ncbi:MAG: hypothetical protein ACJ77V_08195 [Chloroflexota bacterium]|jgi:hypothetical protein